VFALARISLVDAVEDGTQPLLGVAQFKSHQAVQPSFAASAELLGRPQRAQHQAEAQSSQRLRSPKSTPGLLYRTRTRIQDRVPKSSCSDRCDRSGSRRALEKERCGGQPGGVDVVRKLPDGGPLRINIDMQPSRLRSLLRMPSTISLSRNSPTANPVRFVRARRAIAGSPRWRNRAHCDDRRTVHATRDERPLQCETTSAPLSRAGPALPGRQRSEAKSKLAIELLACREVS